MRSRIACLVLAAAAVGITASARAEFLPFLTFEGPDLSGNPDGGEGIGANNGGALGTFGATDGTSAWVFHNKVVSGAQTLFDIGTVNGNPSPPNDPEQRNNYLVFAAAAEAAKTQPVFLQFDLSYDATNITTAGFLQPGVIINSEGGFSNSIGFGGLIGGNIGPGGNFPNLPAAAAAKGITMTVLNPSDFTAGDYIGAVRLSIPTGPGQALPLSDGGTPGFDYAQFGFSINGNPTGTAEYAFDNVGFQIGPVPEPASAGLVAVAGLAMLARRRRSA
jgi:hypothetical protein